MEPDRELVDRYYDAVGRRDVEAIASLIADDVRWSSPASIPGGGIRIGTAAVLEGARVLFAAWPDIEVRLDHVVHDGRGAAVRGRYLTPNGFEVGFSDHLVLRDGKVAAVRSSYDGASLTRALRSRDETA